MMRRRPLSRKAREAQARENMNARLRAEKKLGWPTNGPWDPEAFGYIDLRTVVAGATAPVPTGAEGKPERKQEREDLFRRTGEVAS